MTSASSAAPVRGRPAEEAGAPGQARLAERLAEIATAAKLTVATAESCTGGRLAAAITGVPGASAFYAGGVVAYADEAKVRRLHVDARDIEAHGAVSRQVAVAMAEGALAPFGAGLAMAVTGIAGPDGGSAEKPVGTVWIAVARAGRAQARRLQLAGGRQAVQEQSVSHALAMAVEFAGG